MWCTSLHRRYLCDNQWRREATSSHCDDTLSAAQIFLESMRRECASSSSPLLLKLTNNVSNNITTVSVATIGDKENAEKKDATELSSLIGDSTYQDFLIRVHFGIKNEEVFLHLSCRARGIGIILLNIV